MRAAYTGHETLTFMDYLDGETGRTLTAVPGGVYDVAPSGGRPAPDLPPWFTAVEEKKTAKAAKADGSAAAKAVFEPDGDED